MMDFDKAASMITENLGEAIMDVPAVRLYIAIQLQKAHELGMREMLSADAKEILKITK